MPINQAFNFTNIHEQIQNEHQKLKNNHLN